MPQCPSIRKYGGQFFGNPWDFKEYFGQDSGHFFFSKKYWALDKTLVKT